MNLHRTWHLRENGGVNMKRILRESKIYYRSGRPHDDDDSDIDYRGDINEFVREAKLVLKDLGINGEPYQDYLYDMGNEIIGDAGYSSRKSYYEIYLNEEDTPAPLKNPKVLKAVMGLLYRKPDTSGDKKTTEKTAIQEIREYLNSLEEGEEIDNEKEAYHKNPTEWIWSFLKLDHAKTVIEHFDFDKIEHSISMWFRLNT